MSRTTIMIDLRLLNTAMRAHGLKTRREAVDFALRRLVDDAETRDVRKCDETGAPSKRPQKG